jgi:hypothetical protein
MSEPGRIKDIRVYRNSFVGMGALVCTTFLIFGTWPLYGAAGALPLFALWLVMLAVACRWFVSHPGRVLAIGIGSWLPWLAVVLGHRL